MASTTPPSYGGQAVIEGVLIRGQSCSTVAVRRPDGTIALRADPIGTLFTGRLRKMPLVRGVLALVESLTLGMRALIYSANVGMELEGEEIGKGTVAGILAFSLLFSLGLFFLLPVVTSELLGKALGASDIVSNLAEGIIRLAIFLGYIVLIGRMEQIRRVFMYHGAEHMTVHAQEHLQPLDVASVRNYPTAHPRCGTAFLLFVVVLAIFVFTLVGRDPLWWLLTSRIVLVPVIAGLGYEAIRFSWSHGDNPIVRLIAAPSLALQALTTRQPDDDQIEIAIAAMKHALEGDEAAAAAEATQV
jgi:uncharacterized protein YqhQ